MDRVQRFLDFIARFESLGNYNARYGAAGNEDAPRFTDMTVADVLTWQGDRRFSACGKYQIIQKTLGALCAEGAVAPSAVYDAAAQDALARHLLEKRGLSAFLAGEMAREEFALSVAREWAALPGVLPPFGEKSVYAGDGVNKALVGVDDYLAAIDALLD